MRWPERPGRDLARDRREAERQLEWAEAYLGAVEGIDVGDPRVGLEARRLRGAVADLRHLVARPRVL
jgi:hypothetical protein